MRFAIRVMDLLQKLKIAGRNVNGKEDLLLNIIKNCLDNGEDSE